MELIQVGAKTYYIKNPTNIGIYKTGDSEVFLIDSGNDKDAGKKILKILDAQGWTVKGIISTHSNADHIGGNRVIQERTSCPVYSHGIEKCITENPLLEPAFLYGGNPLPELKNKFLMAKESRVTQIDGNLPHGLEYISLKGHYFDMIGVKTDDDVYFLGDSLFSQETIDKYHLFFIYDVKEYLSTLDALSQLDGKLYVPSHCEASKDITNLINANRKAVLENAETIYSLCAHPTTFEDLLKSVFDSYNLTINPNQFVLIGSTLKGYLTYLYEIGKVRFEFSNNKMYWSQA